MKLRPYQVDLVNGTLARWREGYRRVAAVMATGGGKTVVFSHVAELSLSAGWPVLVLAHRTELIDQAIDKLQQVAPKRRIGRLQGTTKQYRAEVVVGSIQTASTKSTLPLLKTRRWGLIVIDETHHATADTYMRVLRELDAFAPGGPFVLGVTATLGRSDSRSLGDVFEAIVEPRVGLLDLIRHPEGPFLVPPRGVRVKIADLDLSRVRRVAGDFNSGALAAAMSNALAPKKIIEAWREHADGVPTVGFFPNVAFSVEMAEAFRAEGIAAVHLDGTTPDSDRAAALDEFRAGRITVLCNVALFTEGTDLPSIGCVLLGRPTSSTTLYQQMVGRGLRLHPGKRFCWILDITGVTGRHKLATLASLDGAPGEGEVPDDLLMYEEDEEEVTVAPAEDDREATDAPEEVTYADGMLEHELVDLFGEAHSTWLRTPGGVWFVPVPDGFIYLSPAMSGAADRYDLRWHVGHPNQAGPRSGLIQAEMEIGYAMAAGDEYIAARPMWQADRDAPWRSRRRADGKTVGEYRDAQAVTRAAAVLDA